MLATVRRVTDLPRIAVLASGAGSNLQALIDRVHGVTVEIVAVGSDVAGSTALGRAEAAGIPAAAFALANHASREDRDASIGEWLLGHGAETVVLAGYLAILSPLFLELFPQRVVNVHPSLLPSFPGLRAIDQAIERGVKVTGVTVHLVDDGIDTGPILLQRAVELGPGTTVEAARELVRPIEHDLLCQAVVAVASQRVLGEGLVRHL